MIDSARWRALTTGAAGVVVFAGAAELIGQTGAFGPSWPPLSKVLYELADPRRQELFGRAIAATGKSALLGYFIGICGGILAGLVSLFLPPSREGLLRFGVVLQSVPVIAVGPLLLIVVPNSTAPTLAALAVFFITFVSCVAGFDAARPAQKDLFQVSGASRWDTFRYLQLQASLPILTNALRLAVPAALMGAIFGEWFRVNRGIGAIIVSSMYNYQIELLWTAGLFTAATSIVVYSLVSVGHRFAAGRYGDAT